MDWNEKGREFLEQHKFIQAAHMASFASEVERLTLERAGKPEGASNRQLRNKIRYLNQRIEVLLAELVVARAPRSMTSKAVVESGETVIKSTPNEDLGRWCAVASSQGGERKCSG